MAPRIPTKTRCLKKTAGDSVSLVSKPNTSLVLGAETVIRHIREHRVRTLQRDQGLFSLQGVFILRTPTGLVHLAQELHQACKTALLGATLQTPAYPHCHLALGAILCFHRLE